MRVVLTVLKYTVAPKESFWNAVLKRKAKAVEVESLWLSVEVNLANVMPTPRLK